MNRSFPTHHLTLEQKRLICERAKERCRLWWVDELDCRQSFFRQRVEMPFKAVMAKLDAQAHFVIIHRETGENYLEVAFRTMTGEPDYFLWLQLDASYYDRLDELGYLQPPAAGRTTSMEAT